jgi:hypothetical protein
MSYIITVENLCGDKTRRASEPPMDASATGRCSPCSVATLFNCRAGPATSLPELHSQLTTGGARPPTSSSCLKCLKQGCSRRSAYTRARA